MKKLFLTILLAIMTSLTIYFVVFWQPKEYVNEPLEVKETEISDILKHEDNSKEKNKSDVKESLKDYLNTILIYMYNGNFK